MLLDQDAVSDERDRRADGELAVELDRKSVHRDRADDTTPLAGDQNLCSSHVPAEPVRIPDRDDADPGRLLGDEPAPVARALTRRQPLHERERGVPAEGGLEAVCTRICPERRDAVERDPATHGVEGRFRVAEGRSAVRDVMRDSGQPCRCRAKALDLRGGQIRDLLVDSGGERRVIQPECMAD